MNGEYVKIVTNHILAFTKIGAFEIMRGLK